MSPPRLPFTAPRPLVRSGQPAILGNSKTRRYRRRCEVMSAIGKIDSIAPAESAGDSIDISVKGKWIKVPAIKIEQKWIVVRGKWIKLAVVHDEEWLETELQEPESCIRRLSENKSQLKPDIFTFTQKLPDNLPRYPYPMELDSIATIRTISFRDWWDSLPQESRKNV